MSSQNVSTDATAYVRACEDVEALGINPVWIPMLMLAIFFSSYTIVVLTGVTVVFLVLAKRNGAKPLDFLRRGRRIIVGNKRLPFKGF
ncbi:hypothetical protein [Geopseudomonas aromaticivorans]